MGSVGGEGWLFDIIAWGVGASYLGEGSYYRVGAALFKQMLYAHFQPQTDNPGNNFITVLWSVQALCPAAKRLLF